jgi:pullulanase/glycogen debranching enzyme
LGKAFDVVVADTGILALQELGVNCVELMPCHEFNELEYSTSSSKYV